MLVLFDIDGTLLVGANEAHRGAMRVGLRDVYGVGDVPGVSDPAAAVAFAGRTDTAIARDVVGLAGRRPDLFDAKLDAFRAACAEAYARTVPASLSEFVAPGVRELLATLAAREGVHLSLVTGNYEPIARLKLDRAGIGRYFAVGQGAFGSDAEERDLLPAIARARAGRGGEPYARAQTVVVGDTPLDIACARADGVRVIGVASGSYTARELGGADAVVEDAAELARLLVSG